MRDLNLYAIYRQFNRPRPIPLREALERSHDMLDAAELLRLAALSMRESAEKLERQADELDPLPTCEGLTDG